MRLMETVLTPVVPIFITALIGFILQRLGKPVEGEMLRFVVVQVGTPALIFSALLKTNVSGAILVEVVFAYPGIGSWLRQAISDRNYPVIQGGILFVAIIVVFVNLLVDISYGLINPRIRLGGK